MLKLKPILLAAGLALVFLYGLFQLFALRFQAGDIHPLYSTLRADPLGAKALHDSLGRLPSIEVSRNFRPLEKIRDAPDTTLYLLGAGASGASATLSPVWWWSDLREVTNPRMRAAVANGLRVVVTFLPSTEFAESKAAAKQRQNKIRELIRRGDATPTPTPAESPTEKKTDAEKEEERTIEAREKDWGFVIARLERKALQPGAEARAFARPGAPVEPAISWHTTLHFEKLDPAWQVIYEFQGQPVVIERHLGSGSIVLSTDSYFAGNEALRTERHSRLLAWLQGGQPRALFDETHLGVTENPGIATLARRYRLHGVIAGLLLVAALFVWKNMAPFVPPHAEPDAARTAIVSGRDSAAGFINLLRRSIPPRDVLRVSWQEWRKSFAHRKDVASAEAIAHSPESAKRPVEASRQIASLLARSK